MLPTSASCQREKYCRLLSDTLNTTDEFLFFFLIRREAMSTELLVPLLCITALLLHLLFLCALYCICQGRRNSFRWSQVRSHWHNAEIASKLLQFRSKGTTEDSQCGNLNGRQRLCETIVYVDAPPAYSCSPPYCSETRVSPLPTERRQQR